MKAYIYASEVGASAGMLSQCFKDFAELFRYGFLDDDSTVWANAEAPQASFWALTDHSQYVYVHRVTAPGYVRLTNGRMRWARTFDATTKGFDFDLDTKAIPGEPDKCLTLIVKHRVPDQTVKIIDGATRDELVDGVYTKGQHTVIDLSHYKPAEPRRKPTEFEVNHAKYHGVNHMMHSLSPANSELIRDHLDLFAFDIPRENIDAINEHLSVVDAFADSFVPVLYQRLKEYIDPSPQSA